MRKKSNIYIFQYYPERKTAALPQSTSEALNSKSEYKDMPQSLADDIVSDNDRDVFCAMFYDIESGCPASSASFQSKNGLFCHATLCAAGGFFAGTFEVSVDEFGASSETKEGDKLHNMFAMQKQMFELLSCGVLAYTLPDHNILVVNNETKRIFTGDDALSDFGVSTMHSIVKEDIDAIKNAVSGLRKTGDEVSYKFRTTHTNGSVINVFCRTKMLQFKGGKHFILSMLQDVTDWTHMTSLLEKERTKYRDALIANCEYHFTFDLTEGIVKHDFYVQNRGMASKLMNIEFPCKYDTMITGGIKFFGSEVDMAEDIRPLLRKNLLASFEKGTSRVEGVIHARRYDSYATHLILMSKGDEGHVMATVISHDITESRHKEIMKREKLESANKSLHNQMRIIKSFSSIYFATWTVDLRTRTIAELSVPEWLSCIVDEGSTDAQKAFDFMQQKFITDESTKGEMEHFLCLDTLSERIGNDTLVSCEYISNTSGWCSGNFIVAERDESGAPVLLLYAIRSIEDTKRRELESEQALKVAYEAANRANAAKTDFLSHMSHDIRTPMNAIMGMAAIANSHINDPERLSDCLAKITLSSRHLLALINEILDMSRIESGKTVLVSEEFNLPKLIDDMLMMAKSQLQAKGHHLCVHVENVEHEDVIGDSLHIQRVFINILGNAIKYTPSGGKINITVRERPTENSSIGCYEFVFEDNGIGIPREFLDKIFEPFERVESKETARTQGTGLGMAIAKNIVSMMNGDIKVSSTLGKGSRFTVTIYLKLQDKSQAALKSLAGLSVLVADDDEISCQSTCMMLSEIGMNGEWVLSGKEAVERITEKHKRGDDFFAAIIDWQMPDMNGIETAVHIRKTVGCGIPIIIFSSYDWTDIESDARKAGVDVFIGKPLFKSKLLYTFRSILGEDQRASVESLPSQINDTSFSGKRVLLVEDNDINREIAVEILKMMNIEVDTAENGKIAVDKFAASHEGYYDLIFMDVQMPVMDGHKAACAIRALGRIDAAAIPIIAMTANAFAEDVIAARNAGMNEHISKPLDIKRLKKILASWLK